MLSASFLRPSQETPFLGKLAGAGFGGVPGTQLHLPTRQSGLPQGFTKACICLQKAGPGAGSQLNASRCLGVGLRAQAGPGSCSTPVDAGESGRASLPARVEDAPPFGRPRSFPLSLVIPCSVCLENLLTQPRGSGAAAPLTAHRWPRPSADWTIPPSPTGVQIGCLLGWGSH